MVKRLQSSTVQSFCGINGAQTQLKWLLKRRNSNVLKQFRWQPRLMIVQSQGHVCSTTAVLKSLVAHKVVSERQFVITQADLAEFDGNVEVGNLSQVNVTNNGIFLKDTGKCFFK